MSRRVRISVTVDADVLAAVDRLASTSERLDRSEIVEQALRVWLKDRRRRVCEQEITEYYGTTTAAERAEDDEWAALGTETTVRSWDE